MKLTFKQIAAFAALLLFLSAHSSAEVSMSEAIQRFTESKAMHGADIGICVVDLETGETVAAKNEDVPVIPASVMKTVTSATALRALSPFFRFETKIKYDGLVDHAGVLQGNLLIEGGVDPTLESRHFPDSLHVSFFSQCVEELKRRGITAVAGKIITDESIAPEPAVPQDWMDADVAEYYGAGIHGVNYADNECSLIVDLSGRTAKVIDTIPHQKSLKIVNNIRIEGKAYTPSAFRKKNSCTLYLSGKVRRQTEPVEVWTTMPNPAEALAYDLAEVLESEGIRVFGETPKSTGVKQLLFTYYSPDLSDIICSLLTRSDNMYAEAVLRALAIHNGGTATRHLAIAQETELLNEWGISTAGQTLYDGSGLSRSNRITAKFLADVLVSAANDSQTGHLFPALFPKAGVEGTVKRLLKDSRLAGNIALKSGSMTGVKCYAGYYPAESPKYAVVLMTNKYRCNYDQLETTIESLFEGLFLGN